MPRAAYMLEVELSYNTWTDITDDWQIATPLIIERGIEPGERVAGIGRMTFALYNPDGRYTPGHVNATAGFEVGIRVWLRANDGSSTHGLFYGRIVDINPRRTVGDRRATSPQTEIICLDEMAALHRVRLDAFPLMLDVTPREVVNALVNRGFVAPDAYAYWRLGFPDVAELGISTELAGTYTGKDFDVGQSVLPWAGDTWRNAPPAADALRDVCLSEGGYFFTAGDGTPTFDDRHTRPKHLTADATFDGSLAGLRIERGHHRIANRVTITAHPREVSDSVEVVWENTNDILVKQGQPLKLICRYRDPDQQIALLGAKDVIPPQQTDDYTAEWRASYKGQTYSFDATESLLVESEIGAASVELTLTNNLLNGRSLYVTKLQMRGIPLRIYEPTTVVVEDEDSQLTYGSLPLTLDLPLQDDTVVAGDMAVALLVNRKDPHPWITVEVEATASASLLAHGLSRDVGDRLHVTDLDLALDEAACFVESIRHEIGRGGASHRVTWRTSPADLEAYWILAQAGYGELGETTRLGY
jgi:hypothetical protein